MLVFLVIITVLVALAIRGAVIMLLWNWLMPMLTSVPEISFIESVGLYLLVSTLLGHLVDKNVMAKPKGKPAIKSS